MAMLNNQRVNPIKKEQIHFFWLRTPSWLLPWWQVTAQLLLLLPRCWIHAQTGWSWPRDQSSQGGRGSFSNGLPYEFSSSRTNITIWGSCRRKKGKTVHEIARHMVFSEFMWQCGIDLKSLKGQDGEIWPTDVEPHCLMAWSFFNVVRGVIPANNPL